MASFDVASNICAALQFGYFVAGVSEKCVGDDCHPYVTDSKIDAADSITFLWVETFKIGFYGPAVFPLIIAFMVSTIESIGDIGRAWWISGLSVIRCYLTQDPRIQSAFDDVARGPGRMPGASLYTRMRLSLSRGPGRKPGASLYMWKHLSLSLMTW